MRSIYAEVPMEWKSNLMKKVDKYEFIKDLMRKAIGDNEFPEEKKRYYQNLLDSGQMDEIEQVLDPEMAGKIDSFIESRVLEEVEKGNLPKRAKEEIIKKAKKLKIK